MGIKRISSRPGLPAGLPFTLGCDTDGACFISGMPALDPDGNLVPGTFAEEADLALRNVIAIAEASGYASDEIVYVQCVLGDIADYSTLNDWWRRRFRRLRLDRRRRNRLRIAFQSGRRPLSRGGVRLRGRCRRTETGARTRAALPG